MSYKKNNQSNPKSILGKAKDIYQGSTKILKDPAKAMIKAKFNLNQVGKRNIEQAKDASKTNLDKTKLYTQGKIIQGIGDTIGLGAKGLQAGINLGGEVIKNGSTQIKDAYDNSLRVKPVVSDQINMAKIVKDKTKAGMKVVRKHPEAFSLMGGAGAIYAGTKLLSDDNLADLKQIVKVEENTMLTSQLKRRRELLESSYSEPKEGTFYDKVFNSKKEVPDMPDNSGIANLSSKTSDLRYKSEKDQDKEVEEIPTQGGEAPTEESFGKTKIEPITESSDLQVALKIILEAVHKDNVELEKNNGISEKNRRNFAETLINLREQKSKLRKGAEAAKNPDVKSFKHKMANTLDNTARMISNKGNVETLKTDARTALNSKALSTFGNAPRMVKLKNK
jgi:hypothetical protein